MTENADAASGDRTYDPSCFARLFAIEDRHFWFRTRNRIIATLAQQAVSGRGPGCRILEVGCGTGNTLRALEANCAGGRVFGVDLFPQALHFASQRTSASLVCADARALPFARAFDLIGLFDVLEHLPDDADVLRRLSTALRPGGKLVVSVPAHTWLWSYFDEASCHQRRYSANELRRKLGDAGFAVEYLSPMMLATLPATWMSRRVGNLLRGRDGMLARHIVDSELRVTPAVNGLLKLLLSMEHPILSRRKKLPAGSSLIAVASLKPATNGTQTSELGRLQGCAETGLSAF